MKTLKKTLAYMAPILGIVLVFMLIGALVEAANDTLAQKQFNSLKTNGQLTDGADATFTVIAGEEFGSGQTIPVAVDNLGRLTAVVSSIASTITATSHNQGFDTGNSTWNNLDVTTNTGHLIVDAGTGFSAGGTSTPSNAFANPTTALLSQTFNMGWNGATWDLLQVDANKFLKVTLATVIDPVNDGIALYGFNASHGDTAIKSSSNGSLQTGVREGSILAGYGTPGTAINVSANNGKVCTASNALTVGAYYWLKTTATVHYTLVADNSGACATTDNFLFNPATETIYVPDASHDTLCTITDAGTATVQISPVTFVAQ